MKDKKVLILLASIIVAIIFVIIFSYYWKASLNENNNQNLIQNLDPNSGDVPPIDSSNSNVNNPDSSPISSPSADLIPKCNLTGEIIFEDGIFTHKNSQEFNYENVFDPHDIIKWTMSPSGEDFSIGPNRFSGLKAGKGSDYLTISFKGTTPKYKKYTLSASIDYVLATPDGAKIFNEKCSGTTTLTINEN